MLRRSLASAAVLVVLATGAAVVAVPAAASGADQCRTGSPCLAVTIVAHGAAVATDELSTTGLSDLVDQAGPVTYDCAGCAGPTPTVPAATSIRAVIAHEGYSPDDVTQATISGPNSRVELTGAGHDFAADDDPDYPFRVDAVDGAFLYPVFWGAPGGSVQFIRPETTPGDTQSGVVNGVGLGPLGLTLVVTGTHLTSHVTARPARVAVGGTTTLTDTVVGLRGPATYAWDFGDGTHRTTSTAAVAHRFADRGRFAVTVTVTAGAASGAATTDVQVGPVGRRGRRGRGHGSGHRRRHTVSKGPVDGQGAHTGATPRPPDQGRVGATHGNARRDRAGSSHGRSRSTATGHGRTTSRGRAAPVIDNGLVRVDGILLGGSRSGSADPRALSPTGRPETAAALRRGGVVHPAVPWTGIGLGAGVVALLLSGALGESGALRRRRRRRAGHSSA